MDVSKRKPNATAWEEKVLDEGANGVPENLNGCMGKEEENVLLFDEEKNIHEKSVDYEEDEKENESLESIDIDEFLMRSGECGRYQFYIIIKMMVISFPISYVALIFYFIGYDPHWVDLKTGRTHLRDDDRRCSMNRTEWRYDYEKTTLSTEYDLVCVESWKLSIFGSVLFIGWAFGCFVLGFLSDQYGRKALMLPCFFIDLFCLLLHGFVTSLWALVIIRLIMGFFHAAPATNAFVLIVELVGPNYRVLAANVAGLIWGISTVLLALKAYLIDDWRILCIAASAPYFLFILIGFWFPESVRWLNANGRSDLAEKTLHQAAAVNKRPVENVKLKSATSADFGRKYSYVDLFSTSKVAKITTCQGYIWLSLGMVYYTISWAFADLGGDLYLNFVLAALVELPMHAVCIICLQRYGRKKTTCVALLISAFACLVIAILNIINKLDAMKLVVGLIGKSTISLAFMCVYMWSAEIFPTVVRTQGLGICTITSRLGAALSPFVNNLDLVHPALPFIVMVVGLLSSFFCSFYLSETLGRPTRENFEDIYKDE